MNYTTKDEPLIDYPSGAKRSNPEGKGRYDLISPYGLQRLALRYEQGCKSKGERNWEKGFPITRAIDSALRHINLYNMGDREEDHLAGTAWQLFAIMHFEAKDLGNEQETQTSPVGAVVSTDCKGCKWVNELTINDIPKWDNLACGGCQRNHHNRNLTDNYKK